MSNLIQFQNLQYLGAFRIPNSGMDSDSGQFISYNPVNNSLFMTGSNNQIPQTVVEISIPTPIISNTLASLNTAGLLQPTSDPTLPLGISAIVPIPQAVQLGTPYYINNQLIIAACAPYDGDAAQRLGYFVKDSTTLATPDTNNMYAVIGVPQIGFVDGYLGRVADEWQSFFGGDIIAGNVNVSISSRRSQGPAAFVWNSALLQSGALATPLVYYPITNPSIGALNQPLDNQTTFWNENPGDGGYQACMPTGYRSLLFFGGAGIGQFIYGDGTDDPSLIGTYDPIDGVPIAFDPKGASKGQHQWPYESRIIAYDLNDISGVVAGQRNPWTVKPYAVWPLSPFASTNPIGIDGTGQASMFGVAYDWVNQKLYGSSPHANTQNDTPLVYVWQIVNYTGILPTLTIGPTPLSLGITYSGVSGPPTNFTVVGSGLTTPITLCTPVYPKIAEISIDSGSTWSYIQRLSPSNGYISGNYLARTVSTANQVYPYAVSLFAYSSGVSNPGIILQGLITQTGIITPTLYSPYNSDISSTNTILTVIMGSTVSGTAGQSIQFPIMGVAITGGINVSVPINMEISSNSGSTWSSAISVAGTGLVNFISYIRQKANSYPGGYSNNITITSPGATGLSVLSYGDIIAVSPTINSLSFSGPTNGSPLTQTSNFTTHFNANPNQTYKVNFWSSNLNDTFTVTSTTIGPGQSDITTKLIPSTGVLHEVYVTTLPALPYGGSPIYYSTAVNVSTNNVYNFRELFGKTIKYGPSRM